MNVGKINRELCNGCKVCAEICHNSAISFDIDNGGFWYPFVDGEKCDDCGKCRKFCSAYYLQSKNNYPLQAFAAWSMNIELRERSSYGGVFFEFARYILDKGGIVIGCKWTNDFRSAVQCTVNDTALIEKIQNSIYIQSDSKGISAVKSVNGFITIPSMSSSYDSYNKFAKSSVSKIKP